MRLLALYVIIALWSAAAHAQPQPSIEAYAQRPEIDHVALSENGEKVAMVVRSSEKLTAEVVIEGRVPPRLKKRMRRFAESGNSYYLTKFVIHDLKSGKTKSVYYTDFNNVVDMNFIGNDHLFITTLVGSVIIDRRGKSRDAYHTRNAMVLNLKDMKIRPFVFEDELEDEPVDRRALNVLGLVADAADDKFVYIQAMTGEKRFSKSRNHLLKANLDTGVVEVQHRGEKGTLDWFVHPDGRVLAREEYDNRYDDYRIVSEVEGAFKELFESGNTKRPPFSLIGVHPENATPVVLDSAEFDFLAEIGADDRVSGPLLGPAQYDIDYAIVDENRVVQGVKYSGTLPSYGFFDSELDSDIAELIAEAPGASVTIVDFDQNWEKILFRFDGGFTSGMYVLYDRKNKSRKMIAEIRPEIKASAIGETLPFNYVTRDGLNVEAIATLPPGVDLSTVASLKTIVMPHGGPEAYDAITFDWMAQYFANRGYLVLQPNFRGSSGYGSRFTDAGNGEWGGKMQDDITDGLQALVDAQLADPERVCIVGASYGGYAALAGGAFTPDLYKCVVAIAPVSDLHRMLKDEKRQHGRGHWVVDYWEERMADGEARKRKLNAISPSMYAEAFQVPVLLIHGDEDSVVPLVQSEIMQEALERANKTVEFVLLEEGDHWLSETPTRLATLRAASAFVDEHIGKQSD